MTRNAHALTGLLAIIILGALVALPGGAVAVPVPVANGDFEAGLEGWTLIRPDGFGHGEMRVETEDVHGGAQAVRMINEPEGERVLIGLTHGTPIALPDEHRSFMATVWMKAVHAPEMVELRVASAGRDGRILSPWQEKGWRFFRPPVEPHVGQWHAFTCEFVAQDEWGGVVLTLWTRGAGAEVIVDDITIEAVGPEERMIPSSGARLPDPADGVALWWEGPLRKVYPDEAPAEATGEGLYLAAAGDEHEAVQLCLRPDSELRDVSVSFTDLTGPGAIPAAALRANFVGLIDIQNLTSARGVRGLTPDPLLTDASLDLPAEQTTAVWLTLRVPRGTPAGEYEGAVILAGEGLRAEVPLRVRVYGFDLPERPTLRTIARIWQSHPGYEELFLENIQAHRCSGSSYIGGIGMSRENGEVVVDVAGLKEAVDRRLRRHNFAVFNVPRIFLGDASGLYAKDGKWAGLDVFTEEFDRAFVSYCRQVAEALRAEGVMDYAIWQVWDEPHGEMVEQARHLSALVKQAAPDARVYFTTGVIDGLLDLVDIWCLPWPSTYSTEAAQKARAHGAELWAYDNSLYSMDVPDSSLLMRHFLWRLKRYDIRGVEWWAVSQWRSDPWEVPNQYAPQNGGGFFLYPTPDRTGAPIDSIRWESYREGVEDYDILTLLEVEQDRVLAALGVDDERLSGTRQVRELVGGVAFSSLEVSKDPLAAERAKRAACERIEFLLAEPPAAMGTVTTEAGVTLIVAAGEAEITINGRRVAGPVAEVEVAAGEAVVVRVAVGGMEKGIVKNRDGASFSHFRRIDRH